MKIWLKQNFHWIWRWAVFILIGLSLVILAMLPARILPQEVRIIAIGKAPPSMISFWWSIRSGIEAAGREYDVTVDYRAPIDESHVDQQIDLVYEAIAEKPDALILAALDKNRLAEPARAARIAGIHLIMVDSTIESGENPIEECFVATDNIAAGEKLGALISDLLPQGENVLIISPSTRGDSLIGRESGVRKIIEDEYAILPTVDVQGGSSDEVFIQVTQALADHPEIGGIICLNEYTTAGAARAVRGTGMTGKIQLVGFDSSEELINYLEEGLLSAVVIQRPFNMGYLSVVRSLDRVNGRPVEPFYDTGSIVITKDNIYAEENEKLLFPFE